MIHQERLRTSAAPGKPQPSRSTRSQLSNACSSSVPAATAALNISRLCA
ncbi:unnamed protein product [Spirodela intermedia]|uniref:Uncharacterized protein n=1 Tax=Spirodela intermedia TaxID=51605 RepID=A0A7I8JEM8_SPIIN|nr:unnamed protein product [Spirodela intermedia]CAA6667983.1 unnamed protein product [Spirodela intermedia]